ncbi:MAG: hypothetical protein UT34_C0001G0349 [candidate division WS6 bacterium GW2011_GWF2_39_15]|uniref:Zn-dependent hydrolase of the beta-lactamase fold-like protein n=1 Tax=candidate division WS6 bacterium GW2011_GWF2_39_15 TaxID=1619100 RepID=A0A0G0MQK0_9BACT|nr:MAG: hypothetical protein UT34_C0001G0349 [candidate division WS6 bacterium GW2011_GWF2_39_15]
MKIKYNGYTSFTISVDNLTVLTDPVLAKEKGIKGIPSEADVIINTAGSKASDVKPVSRKDVFEINSAGEYEISGLMIQRPLGTHHYILDYELIRVVLIGTDSKDIDMKLLKDLGDVDVLLLPYTDGEDFPAYEALQDIISNVEPAILVPYGTKEEGGKTKEDFLKYFGFSTFTEEKTLKVESRPESEERTMQIVFLS